MTAAAFVFLAFSPLLLSSSWSAESFSPSTTLTTTAAAPRCHRPRAVSLFMSSVVNEASMAMPMEEEDDDEYEMVEEEFELLTEKDFYNTEWKIGTLMENKPRDPKSIDTTWVRLVTTESGDNKAIWGDNSKGTWKVDVPSQFFSISKESFGGWFGKQIWAGTIEDFYYLDGTVRGWSPISAASVDGQWQAVRLGVLDGDRVTLEERGEAPWFAIEEEEDSEEKLELGSGEEDGEENVVLMEKDGEGDGTDDENEGEESSL
eukprot:CAMPEP_0172300634 /NCGR_PEP_ID=MMETSP1058-20130122/2667_1 /TAXON_ID=83371 /ORGANISM="Detonula confervacea, Strain CCMP 353" /LENGTH=260 /DNA_ID=CAMNT_0013010457 /DNA_START=71 /DNA_END=853 /DNA_ORIENTATION=-